MTICQHCGKQTTNNDNQTSLLAYLAYKLGGGRTETTATEALGYILSRSEAARNALRDTIRTGGVDIGPIARVQTEVEINKDARVDLIGFDATDAERALVEVKFWAGLTENQPNTYLERLLQNKNPSALLFVAPESRMVTLWAELRRLANDGEFTLTNAPSAANLMSATINDGPHCLMLTSWRALLGSMSSRASVDGDSSAERDILQLDGLCKQEDIDAFRPLRGDELSLDFPRFQRHLIDLVWDTVVLCKPDQHGIISGHGQLASSMESHGVWITIAGASALFCLNYRHWAQEGGTPLWLWFNNSGATKLDAIRERLQADLVAGKDILPIYLRKGVERKAVVDGIVERLREVRDKLAAP